MAVPSLRQMRQMPHTEIDDSLKSELLGAARTNLFALLLSAITFFFSSFKKESSYGHDKTQ